MLKWNVYYQNFNTDKFETYNIFKHGGFVEHVKRHKKKCETKEELAERLRCELFYYFCCKCEWEVVITNKDGRIIMTPWVGRKEGISLNVTDNTDFDWVGFYDWIAYKRYAREGSIKIDVYDQVMFKFNEFVDYVLENN